MENGQAALQALFDTVMPTLATKADLENMRARLDATMATKAELESFRARLDAVLPTLATKAEIAILPTLATKTDIEAMRAEMLKLAVETHKWMLASVIGMFIGFGGLFLAASNVQKQPVQTIQAQPAPPVVIYLPAPEAKK
jgi:hypothetical protein